MRTRLAYGLLCCGLVFGSLSTYETKIGNKVSSLLKNPLNNDRDAMS